MISRIFQNGYASLTKLNFVQYVIYHYIVNILGNFIIQDINIFKDYFIKFYLLKSDKITRTPIKGVRVINA